MLADTLDESLRQFGGIVMYYRYCLSHIFWGLVVTRSTLHHLLRFDFDLVLPTVAFE